MNVGLEAVAFLCHCVNELTCVCAAVWKTSNRKREKELGLSVGLFRTAVSPNESHRAHGKPNHSKPTILGSRKQYFIFAT